jgi:hypothetical protein
MERKKLKKRREIKIKLTDKQFLRLKAISVLEKTSMSDWVRKSCSL